MGSRGWRCDDNGELEERVKSEEEKWSVWGKGRMKNKKGNKRTEEGKKELENESVGCGSVSSCIKRDAPASSALDLKVAWGCSCRFLACACDDGAALRQGRRICVRCAFRRCGEASRATAARLSRTADTLIRAATRQPGGVQQCRGQPQCGVSRHLLQPRALRWRVRGRVQRLPVAEEQLAIACGNMPAESFTRCCLGLLHSSLCMPSHLLPW